MQSDLKNSLEALSHFSTCRPICSALQRRSAACVGRSRREKLRENTVFVGGCVPRARTTAAPRENVVSRFSPSRACPIRGAISWSAGVRLVYKHRSAPNLQSDPPTAHNLSVFWRKARAATGPVRSIKKSTLHRERFVRYSSKSRLQTTIRSISVIADALHGQWHDGRRCCPGYSWLFPWFSPWESCWCSQRVPGAMGSSRRRISGSPRSASRSIARYLGRKVSGCIVTLDNNPQDAAAVYFN